MNADDMKRYVCDAFDGVDAVDAAGDTFLIYDPHGDLPAERQLPFATIVTGDHYDSASELSGRGAWRLNIGLTRGAYRARFGAPPTRRDEGGMWETGFDAAATDIVLPHPVYASQYWVCVVNPGPATLDAVRELLTEAYDFAVRKHANHRAGRSRS